MNAPLWLPLGPGLSMEEAGGKAGPLGALLGAGLPVPPGGVVPVSAYRATVLGHPPLAAAVAEAEALLSALAARAAMADAVGAGAIAAAAGALAERLAPLWAEALAAPDAPLLVALREAWGPLAAEVGVGPEALRVAVRSSAWGEDGALASSAGQALSVLGLGSPEAAHRAVQAVWASAWSPHALAYRAFSGQAEAPAVAVLVQALVDADASGVAFGADPATGDREVALIDAAWGLGEGVVGGELTPDHVRARKADGAVLHSRAGRKPFAVVPHPEGGTAKLPLDAKRAEAHCLNPRRSAEVVALLRASEAVVGGPADLEWAYAGDRLWALQARPLTALPAPPPEGGWQPPVPDSLWERRNFAEMLPGPVSPLGAGWLLPPVEAQVVALAAELGLKLPLPAVGLVGGFAYTRSGAKPGLTAAWRLPRVFGALALRDPSAWQRDPRGPAAQRLAPLLAAAPGADAEAEAIVGWLEAYAQALAATWRDVHRASGGWRWSELLLQKLLGDLGPVGPWLAPAQADPVASALHDAVQHLSERQQLALAALAGEPDAALAALQEALGERVWARHLARIQAEGARRPHALDPFVPLPFAQAREAAAAVAAQLAAKAGSPAAEAQARHEAGAAAFAAALAQLKGWRRVAAARLWPLARAHAAIRDEAIAALGEGWGEAVAQVQALGRALVREGRLREPSQVAWLKWREARGLAGGLAGPSDAELAERAAAHALASKRVPPALLGQSLGAGPAWHRGGLMGHGASPGRVAGRVRVVHGPEGFASLRPGEVLVAPSTGPAWTPLFARAAAVVTDEGGPLSHASIVARERGIPAVLGTGNATARLQDGQWVTVDGQLGAVWQGRHV